MADLVRSKVARNIDQGDSILGLQFLDIVLVFLVFQFSEIPGGIGVGLATGLATYGALLYVRRRQAEGFLLHAGRWLAGPTVYFAFTGLNEKGEGHVCIRNGTVRGHRGRVAAL